MFTIIIALLIVERISPKKAERLVRWFDPAILWVQRWLGAFYVPSLAVLPLTIQGVAGELSWFATSLQKCIFKLLRKAALLWTSCPRLFDMHNDMHKDMYKDRYKDMQHDMSGPAVQQSVTARGPITELIKAHVFLQVLLGIDKADTAQGN